MLDGGSICMRGLTANTLSIAEKDSGRSTDVDIPGFPYVLIWSAAGQKSMRFICIEPWHNLQDTVEFDGDWNQKPCGRRAAAR